MAGVMFYTAVITAVFTLGKAQKGSPYYLSPDVANMEPHTVSICGDGKWKGVAFYEYETFENGLICPNSLSKKDLDGGYGGCGRPEPSGPGCTEFYFPSLIQYSRVCGIVLVMATGSPDGLRQHGPRDDVNFLDGIVISRQEEKIIWVCDE